MKDEIFYVPPAGQRVWDWFWELEKGRQSGMGPTAISWSDIEAWKNVTGAEPEQWELSAMYKMGNYRIDPDYDPAPKKPEEPVSIIKSLREIKDAYDKEK